MSASSPEPVGRFTLPFQRTPATLAGISCLASAAAVAYIVRDVGGPDQVAYLFGLPLLVFAAYLLLLRKSITVETGPNDEVLAIGRARRWLAWTLSEEQFELDGPATLAIRRTVSREHSVNEGSITHYEVLLSCGEPLVTCMTRAGARRICAALSAGAGFRLLPER